MILISPKQIREATFTTRHHWLHGDCYDADEVDELLDQAALSLQIVSENYLLMQKQLLERNYRHEIH